MKRHLINFLTFFHSNVERSVCSPHSVMEQLQVLECKLNHMDGFVGEEWISYKDAGQAGLYLRKSLSQVIAALRETGVLDNTAVIFTADHGELAMEHRQFYKMSMFEGSSHVPLLIMGPEVKSGLQVQQLVSLVDLYPTVLGKKGENMF
ncbi:hypothetical protein XENOCAPTIV_002796 [Xenoophorus captivus]|uniref:Sulfatase N-terminal domain-containing protein n=1 Tax=Xenoophorus captivus TaxID=1517983 RepID=A0ABV0RBN2_9TELE